MCYFGMESIRELLGTLLLPGKKIQTMEIEVVKAVCFPLSTAGFWREALMGVFLDTASSDFQL